MHKWENTKDKILDGSLGTVSRVTLTPATWPPLRWRGKGKKESYQSLLEVGWGSRAQVEPKPWGLRAATQGAAVTGGRNRKLIPWLLSPPLHWSSASLSQGPNAISKLLAGEQLWRLALRGTGRRGVAKRDLEWKEGDVWHQACSLIKE